MKESILDPEILLGLFEKTTECLIQTEPFLVGAWSRILALFLSPAIRSLQGKMLSMAVQSPFNNTSTHPLLFSEKFNPRILKTPILLKPAAHTIHSSAVHGQKLGTISRKQRKANTFAAPEAVTAESESETIESEEPFSDQETEMPEVLVKKVEKPMLVLKFIWMEKNIGLALDQAIPGHGTVPLSPYFFWPRKDAWEELKATLESKPWISQKKMIILLNQATDIINLWQQSGGSLTTQ